MKKIYLAVLLTATLSQAQAPKVGELKAEADAHQALWAASYGFENLEDARKGVPMLLVKARLAHGNKVKEVVPAEILATPKEKAVPHYEKWAASIFVNPWSLEESNKNWDPKAFIFVSSNGHAVKGSLPNGLPKGPGKAKNLIRFKDPVTDEVTTLTLDHECETGETERGTSTRRIEGAYLGEMEPFKADYKMVNVEHQMDEKIRSAVHDVLAGDVRSVASALRSKEIKPKAAQFSLDSCQKLKSPNENLKRSMEILRKEIAGK